jgi:hypothetical protein
MTISLADLDVLGGIPTSRLAHHEHQECAEARSLVLGRLTNRASVAAALSAIPLLVHWGPSKWPVYWCELASSEDWSGDCGVHADLAGAVLDVFDVPHTRGRAAIRPTNMATTHWRTAWKEADCDDTWIGRTLVHHEVLRIGDRWWDPTEACWLTGPGARLLAGRVHAVREDAGYWLIDGSGSV